MISYKVTNSRVKCLILMSILTYDGYSGGSGYGDDDDDGLMLLFCVFSLAVQCVTAVHSILNTCIVDYRLYAHVCVYSSPLTLSLLLLLVSFCPSLSHSQEPNHCKIFDSVRFVLFFVCLFGSVCVCVYGRRGRHIFFPFSVFVLWSTVLYAKTFVMCIWIWLPLHVHVYQNSIS